MIGFQKQKKKLMKHVCGLRRRRPINILTSINSGTVVAVVTMNDMQSDHTQQGEKINKSLIKLSLSSVYAHAICCPLSTNALTSMVDATSSPRYCARVATDETNFPDGFYVYDFPRLMYCLHRCTGWFIVPDVFRSSG